jgi:RNA polymerase sigma-70 factor (ECF subfamily)
MDDATLLQRIGQSDREAFAQFYERFSGLLFSVIVKVLNDVKETEDVTQEVFLHIWDKAVSYDPAVGKPLNWILTLTRNKAIDRLRALRRRFRFVEETTEQTREPANPPEREPVFDRDRVAILRSAVNGLPGEQRRAIEMAFFGGMTQNEISEALKQPLGTIKARIHRGMLKLLNSLEDRF